jgi:lysozyme
VANVKARLAGAALAATVALVSFFEGHRLMPYRDPVGIWTDCVGHTGPDVVPGRKNTPEQCKAKLADDLWKAEYIVDRCYPGITGYPKGAMMSLAFNMGPGGIGVKDGICTLKSGNEPTMRRKFERGDIDGMCHEIPKWANPPLPGIIKRRAAEEKLCLTK